MVDLSALASDEEVITSEKAPSPPPQVLPPAPINKGDISDLQIKVNFLGNGTASREAWVLPAQRKNDLVFKDADNNHTTSLKQVVPALSIIGTTGNPYTIGTIDQFLTGNFHDVLALKEADTCALNLDPTSKYLVLELLLEAKKNDRETTILPHMKPLEVVNERIKRLDKTKGRGKRGKMSIKVDDNEEHEWPENLTDKDFMAFLCSVLDGSADGYPGLKNLGEFRGRYLTLINGVKFLDENWKSSTRGIPWRVPQEYKDHENVEFCQYAGRPLVKKDVEHALDIGHTIAGRDRDIFEHADLQYDPLIQQWTQGDNADAIPSKDRRRFSAMTRKQFFAHLEDYSEAEKLMRRLKKLKKERAEQKAKKQAREAGPSKSNAKPTSANLDDDDRYY
ncbi:hypothetical protein C8F04DRAFT_1248510 [Mycena alexandri]|uniref:Uncharacterized protein n=1 Tax=Mycena alexandri TaxID=1745969 RepID=A0AAD6THM8_9AGAR|nr:hypothetical protein C8F04DRAFT_1248510 [Mycena alexandri]